ncbi:hypothetical protein RA28_05755 [Ruegeria sp. ANG-S4]|nr:hypothetical protein RA28_05755 [Ruegeria sp. ANG-S4]
MKIETGAKIGEVGTEGSETTTMAALAERVAGTTVMMTVEMKTGTTMGMMTEMTTDRRPPDVGCQAQSLYLCQLRILWPLRI